MDSNCDNKNNIPIGAANKRPVPELGDVVKTAKPGVYAVAESAIVGRVYRVSCPKCGKPIYLLSSEAKVFRVKHEECNVPVIVKAVKADVTIKVPVPGQKSNARLSWWTLTGRKSYVLHSGENYIGRKDDKTPSHLSLKDEYASAKSVCIDAEKTARGYSFHLRVLHATNPVLVNGKEMAAGCGIDLNYGDILKLGNTTLTFNSIEK